MQIVLEMQEDSRKDMAVLLPSILLRSELRANSNEELGCELELYPSEVDRYRCARFCKLLVDDMTWRVYTFLLCTGYAARMQRSTSPLTYNLQPAPESLGNCHLLCDSRLF